MNINNKKVKNIFWTMSLGVLLFSQGAYAGSSSLDKVVAVVNSTVITQGELDRKIVLMKRQLARTNTSLPASILLRQRALDELIDTSLQVQLAKRNNIQISDKEFDNIITNIAKNNKLTVAQLKKTLPEQERMSFNEFRRQLRENGLVSRVQQAFLGKEIAIKEQDIEEVLKHPPKVNLQPAYYHVVDILIEIPDGATKEQFVVATKLANNMLKKLQRGIGVEAAVIEGQRELKDQIVRSDDLGWRKISDFPELFTEKVVKMQVNQVVGPITAPNGLHLLKLLEVRGATPSSAIPTKDQAYEILYYRKLGEKLKPWLQELRDKAYIKVVK